MPTWGKQRMRIGHVQHAENSHPRIAVTCTLLRLADVPNAVPEALRKFSAPAHTCNWPVLLPKALAAGQVNLPSVLTFRRSTGPGVRQQKRFSDMVTACAQLQAPYIGGMQRF